MRYGHGVSLQFFAVPGGRINNAVGLRIVSSDFENAEALRLSGVLGVAGAKRLGQSGVIEGLGLNRLLLTGLQIWSQVAAWFESVEAPQRALDINN